MALDLPASGEEPWGDKLNAAITAIDTDLQASKTSFDSRLDSIEADGGGGGAEASRYVPVFIFSGESNSGGMADNAQATPAELAPRPEVQIFDSIALDKFMDLDVGTNNNTDHEVLSPATHGWEIGLANSVAAGEWWNDTVYLIQTGQGNSKIAQWNVGGTYYTKFLQRVHGGLNILRNQGKVPIIYMWYSMGINDAVGGTNEATWLTSVKELHARMRKEIGYIPIFMTRFMLSSGGASYNDSIDLYGTQDNMLIPVDGSDLTTRDAHHWDYAGMKALSARMGSASKAFGQHQNYMLKQTAMLAGGGTLTQTPVLPSLVRSPSSVSFVEGSAGATFTVKLSAAPTATVVVTVGVSGGNVQSDKASLTFTTANWGTDQTVTLTSPDDGTGAGNRSSTVTLSSAGVAAPATVSVTVNDAYVSPGPANTVLPAISGSTSLGSTLTCSSGTWTGSPTGYAYQWKRNGTAISGETANTHVIVAADQGQAITCTVTATNPSGSTDATSAATNVPAAPTAPVNTTAPAVTGTVNIGDVLSCSTGAWTQSPTGYAYQWKRDGADIAGQTANTYTIVAGDAAKSLSCTVTATNAAGSTNAASNSVSIPTPPLTLNLVTWGDFSGTNSPSQGVIANTTTTPVPSAKTVESVDLTRPWELEVEYVESVGKTIAVVIYIDDDPTPISVWNNTNDFIIGQFQYNGDINATIIGGAGIDTNANIGVYPCRIKMVKSGNDVVFYYAPGASAYGASIYTQAGVLAGFTTGYIKALFVSPGSYGGAQSVTVKLGQG